jgi:hypothetical protein
MSCPTPESREGRLRRQLAVHFHYTLDALESGRWTAADAGRHVALLASMVEREMAFSDASLRPHR